MNIRLRRPLLRGRRIIVGGKCVCGEARPVGCVVDLSIWEKDDLGELLAPGTAEVVFPGER